MDHGRTSRGAQTGEYNPAMEERITELESRIAFQGQTLDDLDGEVRLMVKRLERLEKLLSELAREPRAGREDVGPHDEKPPHY